MWVLRQGNQFPLRSGFYVEETGTDESWELDALSPPTIDGLLESAISGLVDRTAWDLALREEEDAKDRLTRVADDFQ